MERQENNSQSSPPGSANGSPSDEKHLLSTQIPELLSDEDFDFLTVEEKIQYREIVENAERAEDLANAAAGLTLDLADFERQAWNIVEPDTPLQWNWHYDYLCEWLTLVSTGEFKKQFPELLGLIINVPPRSGKSTFATVNWPVWSWARSPSRRFVIGSHNLDLAAAHNGKRSFLIRSAWFQERFGNRFSLTTNAGGLLQNDRTGRYQVCSINSGATGFGGLILIGDDLLERSKAFSESTKKQTNHFLDTSFNKMLDDRIRGVTVHISQRLAVDDPTGHLLGEDLKLTNPAKAAYLSGQWKVIKIRREATQPEEYVYPISGHVHHRATGDILQGDTRCPPMVVVGMKMNARDWANQEQQEPTPETGALLKRNWIRWYTAGTPMPTFFQVVVSVDCNLKDATAQGNKNDLVAIHKYALAHKRRILLDRRAEQLGFGATKQAIKEMARGGQRVSWLSCLMPAATQVLIEIKANGPAVVEQLRSDPDFPLAVIPYNPTGGSKTERFIAATADALGGIIEMPEDAPWMGELGSALFQYAGEGSIPNDDDCDAFSQLINWSRESQYGLLAMQDKMERQAKGITPHRCMIPDPVDGKDLTLEFDEVRGVWFAINDPSRTFNPGDPEPPTEPDASAA